MSATSERICILELQFSPGGTAREYAVSAMVRSPQKPERHYPQARIAVPLDQLADLRNESDDLGYGRKLAECLFAGPEDHLKNAFNEALTIAEVTDSTLRVRIIIDPRAAELHSAVWELLAVQGLGPVYTPVPVPIATDEKHYFSRYLNPPIKALRQFSDTLRCVVLIANPRHRRGADLHLDDIDVPRQALVIESQMQCEVETVRLLGAAASRSRLLQEVRQGADIVYIVCHGKMIDGKPLLYFESANRELEEVDGVLLAQAIAGMREPPPTLVVFGSCESAGKGNACENLEEGFLASIGAHMIAAGVPAVIGMQGAIEQSINQDFYGPFFRDLFQEGQVEHATAIARNAIRDTKQWWMPALLLSKEDGQLWPSRPARQEFEEWTTLVDNVERDRCVPILGSNVVGAFSNRAFLEVLQEKVRKEIGIFATSELPWVAQQWSTINNPTIYQKYDSFIQDQIEPSGVVPNRGESLQDAVSRWGKKNPEAVSALHDLASLPFSLYMTANPDMLLEQELKLVSKSPRSGFCPWHDNMRQIQSNDDSLSEEPTPESPWVYHLFGWLRGAGEAQSSVVLTEDDFFEHLIWISKNEELLSKALKTKLLASSLVFVGFNLRDWEFRTLIHCISKLQGSKLLGSNTHVAVQLPLDADFEERTRMQRCLQEFYTKNKSINLTIYYGSVDSFTSKLKRRWLERHPEEATCPVQELSK
jgi:hypothetical protein